MTMLTIATMLAVACPCCRCVTALLMVCWAVCGKPFVRLVISVGEVAAVTRFQMRSPVQFASKTMPSPGA